MTPKAIQCKNLSSTELTFIKYTIYARECSDSVHILSHVFLQKKKTHYYVVSIIILILQEETKGLRIYIAGAMSKR